MPRGFSATPTGFRAWVRVSSTLDRFDELKTRCFPRGTSARTIHAWRDDTRIQLRLRLETHRERLSLAHGTAGTFHRDAQQYLEAVRALPTYAERVREIALWIAAFGPRPRGSIKPHEIRAVRDRWLTVGPRRVWQRINGVGQWIDLLGPLAASTVNHRLRALSNLWTVLDGRHAPNPVREVPEAPEPRAIPRALDYDTIRAVLAAMSDQGRALKGQPRREHSLAKVRTRVLAWTGITPTELAGLTPEAVHWDDDLLIVPGRRKGRGAPGRIVPLSPDARAALRDFDRLQAYGAFQSRAVLRAWQRACVIVLGTPTRLYDLRHSFITSIVRATKNLTTAQLLAGHQDPKTTRRYALSAVLPTLRAGIEAFTNATTPQKKTP